MKIIIEDNVHVTKNTHVINTGIFIKHNKKYFPFEHWTDFAFPILEEWKYNLLKIENEKNISVNLYFHDGPFWMEVYKKENMVLEIKGINDRADRKTEFNIEMYFYDLLKVILDAMNIFSAVLIKNNLDNGEFESVFLQINRSINELEMKLITEK